MSVSEPKKKDSDAQANLDLFCPQMPRNTIYHGMAY